MSSAHPILLASLLPGSWFAPERPEWLLWVLAVTAIAMLVFGADRAVGSAAKFARTLGMSTVLVGATVVSLGTTTPEAVVSVRAAIAGSPGLALGNGVGSIICDTALIFGLCCLLKRLPLDRFVLNRQGWLQLGAGVLLTATALVLWLASGDIDQVWIPRPVGVGFLVLLVGYLVLSARWARRHPQMIPQDVGAALAGGHLARRTVMCLLVLLFGLALVVLGSDALIGSAKEICRRRHVPEAVLAVAFVALGTSLPELATAVAALIKGHPDLLVGNIIGADILNVLFVIGVSSALVPLEVNEAFYHVHLPVMMGVLILMQLFASTRGARFRRWHGVMLLAIYVGYVALLASTGLAR